MLSIDPAKPDMYVHMSVRMNDTDTAARQFLHVHMLVLYEVNGVARLRMHESACAHKEIICLRTLLWCKA
jgi:hypothetical protein